jgi:hypothetical protein
MGPGILRTAGAKATAAPATGSSYLTAPGAGGLALPGTEGKSYTDDPGRSGSPGVKEADMLGPAPRTIHYTQLQRDTRNGPLSTEWNTYLDELPRLLAEGHEGKFVLIKGNQVIGLFETWDDARREGQDRFFMQAMFIHQIRTEEPVYRFR